MFINIVGNFWRSYYCSLFNSEETETQKCQESQGGGPTWLKGWTLICRLKASSFNQHSGSLSWPYSTEEEQVTNHWPNWSGRCPESCVQSASWKMKTLHRHMDILRENFKTSRGIRHSTQEKMSQWQQRGWDSWECEDGRLFSKSNRIIQGEQGCELAGWFDSGIKETWS